MHMNNDWWEGPSGQVIDAQKREVPPTEGQRHISIQYDLHAWLAGYRDWREIKVSTSTLASGARL